jgi:hypothetical protein
MPVPIKTANEKIADLKVFLPNAKKAIAQFEALSARLEADADFRKLWETDSAKALEAVGIDPEARQEMGLGPYEHGPECNNCITPQGNACHC